MIRGFLLGITYGVALAIIGLVGLAIWGTQPPGSQPPEAPLVEAPEAVAVPATVDTAFAAADGNTDTTEATAPVGLVAPLGAVDEGTVETDPGTEPSASGIEGALSDPATEAQGGADVAPLAPVAPTESGASPYAPSEDAAAVASTVPAAPPVQPIVAADEIADNEVIADLTPAPEAAPEPEPLPEASEPNIPQVGFSGQPATVLPRGQVRSASTDPMDKRRSTRRRGRSSR